MNCHIGCHSNNVLKTTKSQNKHRSIWNNGEFVVFQLLSEELLKYANNLLALNGSCLTFLEKAHTKLTHVLDVNGKIPVKK